MLAALFANYPLQLLDTKALPIHFGLYDALSRVAWSIALCYIIFACVHNSGGYINSYLSHPFWQPISRLCYSTYLLHFPVILGMTASIKSSAHSNQFKAVLEFVGVYLVTIIVSIIATLTFESPFLIIEKLIFKSPMETKSQNLANKNRVRQSGDSKKKIM